MLRTAVFLSRTIKLTVDLYLKPYGPHQFESIASLYHAGAQLIIENHLPFFKMVLEMRVVGERGKLNGDARQRQIVRRNQPNRSTLYETAHHSFSPDAAIMRVRPV